MPRIYRTQKEIEQLLIREFLGYLDYRISNPEWERERPDALLTLSKDGKEKRVAIEHTEYFNDTLAGCCSPLTPIEEFWQLVQASLIRRVSHRKHLTGINARIKIEDNLNLPRKLKEQEELARQLAEKLVNFIEAHQAGQSERLKFRSCDFNGYPMLESKLSWLRLSRWTDDAVPACRSAWTCENIKTGGICLSLEYIKSAIKKKIEKATGYNWGDANEKWLLIAASGGIISNNAGALMHSVNWTDPKLLDLCRESPFDRIVFWERVHCWHKWLKPGNN